MAGTLCKRLKVYIYKYIHKVIMNYLCIISIIKQFRIV